MFYTFRQNNSGGDFVEMPEKGIGRYVIIEADDSFDASMLAEQVGLYFGGVSDGRDCSCCGDRWHMPYEAYECPTIYDEPIKLEVPYTKGGPMQPIHPDGEYIGTIVYIHYKDGTMKLGLYTE